jgi:hypothetical protein
MRVPAMIFRDGFPTPNNIIGKSSVLPWQQEDRDNTNFHLW